MLYVSVYIVPCRKKTSAALLSATSLLQTLISTMFDGKHELWKALKTYLHLF